MNNYVVISPFTILFTHSDNPPVLNINWKFLIVSFNLRFNFIKENCIIIVYKTSLVKKTSTSFVHNSFIVFSYKDLSLITSIMQI